MTDGRRAVNAAYLSRSLECTENASETCKKTDQLTNGTVATTKKITTIITTTTRTIRYRKKSKSRQPPPPPPRPLQRKKKVQANSTSDLKQEAASKSPLKEATAPHDVGSPSTDIPMKNKIQKAQSKKSTAVTDEVQNDHIQVKYNVKAKAAAKYVSPSKSVLRRRLRDARKALAFPLSDGAASAGFGLKSDSRKAQTQGLSPKQFRLPAPVLELQEKNDNTGHIKYESTMTDVRFSKRAGKSTRRALHIKWALPEAGLLVEPLFFLIEWTNRSASHTAGAQLKVPLQYKSSSESEHIINDPKRGKSVTRLMSNGHTRSESKTNKTKMSRRRQGASVKGSHISVTTLPVPNGENI